LQRLLADPIRKLQAASSPASAGSIAMVQSKWSPLADYAPPSPESMRYFGMGVPPEEAAGLAKAERVFIIDVTTPRTGVLLANRAAAQLLADLAEATGGRIWDDETRLLYSVDRWKSDRIDTWQDGLPDMSKHVTMHAYQNPELIRIITLGMKKFGLPDLVLTDLPSRQTRPAGNFLNALMQRLVEGQQPDNSRLRLMLAEIRHRAVRTRSLENPGNGAKGSALVLLRKVSPQEGDPANLLWQADFPEAKLKQTTERTLWAMAELFGSTDSIVGAKSGDAELALARERARKAFFAQEAYFRHGLPLKEHLLVKAPFSEGGQTEYMWVEVTTWHEKEVEGILTNDPYYVKRLHDGSRVTVALGDVYDYIFYKADGTEEGNETGKVLDRMQK
jgi:uncharacterized protein YegJ (DUF2314 family)